VPLHFFRVTIHLKNIILLFIGIIFFQCSSGYRSKTKNKPYEYGFVPKTYEHVVKNYEKYSHHFECRKGETIASIGAGNGRQEIQISCFIDDITWYLEEIDSSRLFQFDKVLNYHEKLRSSPIDAEFNLVLGSEITTTLPIGIFDRVIMINVFHEIVNREPLLMEFQKLLKPEGKLVIMERMGNESGQFHKDCKHPKLFEPEFLSEMSEYGYKSINQQVGEQMSALMFYTFKSTKN